MPIGWWPIAGINPERGSLGSAVWPEWLVDGDLAHEIDSREIPAGWTTGYVPLRKSMPYEQPRTDDNGIVFHLSPDLVNWAYQLTKKFAQAGKPAAGTGGKVREPHTPAALGESRR